MALKLNTITPTGFECKEAYLRCENVSIINKNKIIFNIKMYKNIKFEEFEEINYSCSYDINGENPIKQAYLHLKTLPEFVDAVDC